MLSRLVVFAIDVTEMDSDLLSKGSTASFDDKDFGEWVVPVDALTGMVQKDAYTDYPIVETIDGRRLLLKMSFDEFIQFDNGMPLFRVIEGRVCAA